MARSSSWKNSRTCGYTLHLNDEKHRDQSMGAENSIAPSTVQCGACTTNNLATATFCKGCGHALHEPCGGCSTPMLLTQKFCESCGADLVKALRAKHDQHEKQMSEAVAAAKESDFDRAIAILKRIVSAGDYRFMESMENANQAIAKIEELRDRATAMAQEAMSPRRKHSPMVISQWSSNY